MIATHLAYMGVPDVKTSPNSTSSCRYCIHYTPSGRRGGNCQQLGVPVQSSWKACPLALRAFSSAWDSVDISAEWQDEPSLPDVAHMSASVTTIAVA
ncbi:MAG: hypothetical protein NZ772_10115 [Cyanobacteria bacterium]|nr:hypothetical protein [Cyanobacteriota bacterium]MDW8201365.1 hypothetical protein [Cyanobacteriota bacterium SKYGB_h_bin112]